MKSFEKWLREQPPTIASNSNASRAARKAWDAAIEEAGELLRVLRSTNKTIEEALDTCKSTEQKDNE